MDCRINQADRAGDAGQQLAHPFHFAFLEWPGQRLNDASALIDDLLAGGPIRLKFPVSASEFPIPSK